jgi:phospho-N-acetylmuramoyl-pentapeptide-transferase
MLYKLIYLFHDHISWLNVFRYITFRTIVATLFALFLVFFFGSWAIKQLRHLQIGQYIREEGPESHKSKQGTPTMGGCLLLPAIMIATLLWAEPANAYIWIVLLVALCFSLIGFTDDYIKTVRKNNRGLSAKAKFSMQVLVALIVAIILYFYPSFNTKLNLPFLKTVTPKLGLWYIPVAVFIIVGFSNAVNLTDGLDGLAIGPIIIAFFSYLIFTYLAGNMKIANYLQIPYMPGSGELTVICGAIIGAGLGFLWFNAYPADLFMGDVGSLPLGAILGTIAVITKQEIILILVGGIFVMETLSVIFQVAYFKITGGRRIFRMAPLHHHFELVGVPESKVTVRFWIIAIILAVLSMSTLKLR